MKIALLDDWMSDALKSSDWSQLSANHQLDVFHDTLTGSALIERLYEYDILGIMRERTKFDAAVIDALPNLKAIVTTGKHNNAIDIAHAAQKQIVVMGTDSPGFATAELAMTLIGALARQLVPSVNSMQQGGWQVATGSDLRGKTLGILGLGRLGKQLAHFGKAYGMDIQAYSQNLTAEICQEQNVRYCDKQTFFETSDFISIHLKMSDRVRHLVGADELQSMKNTAYLVNTSRSGIIDTDALVAALHSGSIKGAAIDVYDKEPVPADDPLRTTPNLVMTPHIGYVTAQTMVVFYDQMREIIESYIAGKPISVIT